MTLRTVQLPAQRIWLRVAKPDWADPLDPTFAQRLGGRWNPPNSFPTLYLSGNVLTARMQIERMCAGTPVTPDDLSDNAYALVATTLPTAPPGADAVSDEGLNALGLPPSYPLSKRGALIAHDHCQPIGARVKQHGHSGVWCRSACTTDGSGREFAWFPVSHKASQVWDKPLPFGIWRHADNWRDLEVAEQPDPSSLWR